MSGTDIKIKCSTYRRLRKRALKKIIDQEVQKILEKKFLDDKEI